MPRCFASAQASRKQRAVSRRSSLLRIADALKLGSTIRGMPMSAAQSTAAAMAFSAVLRRSLPGSAVMPCFRTASTATASSRMPYSSASSFHCRCMPGDDSGKSSSAEPKSSWIASIPASFSSLQHDGDCSRGCTQLQTPSNTAIHIPFKSLGKERG